MPPIGERAFRLGDSAPTHAILHTYSLSSRVEPRRHDLYWRVPGAALRPFRERPLVARRGQVSGAPPGESGCPFASSFAQARSQLNVYMQQNPQRKRVSPIFWRVSIAFVTVMTLFLASGTAFAQQALPGDALYNWKLTSEHIWRYTYSDQIGYDITLSNRRMHELLVVSGDEGRREAAILNYEKLLVKFRNAEDADDRARILLVLRAQHQELLQAGVMIPELESFFPR